MGLDMYLKRANLHGYTPEQAEATNSYFSMMRHNERHPENQYTSIKDWASKDDSLLEGGVIEALRSEYQPRYFHWDTEKMFPMPDVFEQVGYWRKANAVHGWFVHNVMDDVDDCENHIVSKEQLENLKADCEAVLARKTLAKKLLPVYDGFYFGSQKYDKAYYSDLQSTIEIIDKVLAETNWDVETVCYEASW